MECQNDRSVDSVFGQTIAFSLNDERVNPAVVKYLSSVRDEALRTSALRISEGKRHAADIYDEDDTIVKKKKPNSTCLTSLQYLNFRIDEWLAWFRNTQKMVLESGYLPQQHTEKSLNLLLGYLKVYLSERSDEKGSSVHLLKVLEKLPKAEEDETLELDKGWAEKIVKSLQTKQIDDIDDIKAFLTNADTTTPVGFKQWYQYLQQNEPSQAAFGRIINERNIWVLIQYMAQEWIKTIAKCRKPRQAIRFSNWLFYLLINVPANILADHTSNLRNLGKKCRAVITKDAEANTEGYCKKDEILLKKALPSDLKQLGVLTPPDDLDIIQLTLAIVASSYGQTDLIDPNIA